MLFLPEHLSVLCSPVLRCCTAHLLFATPAMLSRLLHLILFLEPELIPMYRPFFLPYSYPWPPSLICSVLSAPLTDISPCTLQWNCGLT